MKVGGLFSGIGGFELGLSRAGFEISWMVEIDEFCRKVLKKHAPEYWPNARILEDVTKVGKEQLTAVDLICGGFPCQPFSQAGKRKGKTDDRYLWPEMLRIIRELSPRWIIGENVAGFINMELENAFTDLEAEGYKVEAFVLPAYGVGAPHERKRIWIVAHRQDQYKKRSITKGNRCGESKNKIRNGDNDLRGKRFQWQGKPPVCGVVNGVSFGLDRNRRDRIKSLGNAVVPQIPEILGRFILEIENELLKDNT